MFKTLRKIVIVGVALMGAVVAHGATTRYVELRSTLQPNTTGLNAIFVSSGTILNFRASTGTINGPLTVTGLSTLASVSLTTISGTINDVSTTTHSGGHTFSSATITAASIGTLSGTLTDNTVATHANGQTFSTMTVTDARFLAMTINGAIKDRNLSTGTTWDYMLGGSSSTWSHAGLVIQSTQSFVLNLSSAANSATFVKTNAKVTITPKFANSIMRITFSSMLANTNPSADTCEISIFRNASNLAPTGGSTDWTRFTSPTAGNHNVFVGIGPFNDLPGATTAQTYEIYMRNSAGGSTCTLGSAGVSNLIIDEIGQ